MSSELKSELKSVCVGYEGAGRTSLLITHITGCFPTGYIPTVFDNPFLELDGLTLRFFDTAGGEDYPRLRPLCYPRTNVFILCFDVSSRKSFKTYKRYWYAELRHHCPDVPIVLVRTKTDLRESESDCVTREEGEKLAEKTNSHYAEVSSLRREGLEELFSKVFEIGEEHCAKEQKEYIMDEQKEKCIVLFNKFNKCEH